jgi:Xaa-Pro dipeptidase
MEHAMIVSLTREGCAARQARFCKRLAGKGIDAAIITDVLDVYYFTGVQSSPLIPLPQALVLYASGEALLVTHGSPDPLPPGVVKCLGYMPSIGGTTNFDNANRVDGLLEQLLAGRPTIKKLGYQSQSSRHDTLKIASAALGADAVAIDCDLQTVQRKKEADEVAMLRESARINLAAYEAVRKAIVPGVTEVEVLAAGAQAALKAAGEWVQHNGDFQSGQLGGYARDRRIEAGELYIVDQWIVRRHYWSDLCRTFAVGEVSREQREVVNHIAALHEQIAQWVRPGVSGAEVHRKINADRLKHFPTYDMPHHGGHATGVRAHESPDINIPRDAVLEEGDVVCVEPGAYHPSLRAGVRTENTYIVTPKGGESISPFPMTI